MLWLQRLTTRARTLVLRSRTTREVDDELRFHIDREVAEHVARGMSPDAARTAALRAFGGVQRFKEEVRDEHGFAVLDQLRQDLSYTARAALRSPGFTAIVVVTLALGVGATTAIFSVVRGVLLRELPFGSPDRLVRMWAANPTRNELRASLSLPDFDDWRRLGTAFDRMAAYSTLPTGLALLDGGEPVRLRTAYVSADFFSTLGVNAVAGRTILPAEHVEGRDRVVVMSHRLWTSRYAASRDIVGTTLRMNDEPYTVVGVMPPAVRFPDRDTEIWVPMSVVPATGVPRIRGVRWLEVIGRLAPGVTVERARADMGVVSARLAGEYGNTNAGWTAATVVSLRDELLGSSRGRVLVLFGAVLLTLLLACVNVANLVLARASRRARELAVRTALGAGRARLARQLFTESIALALAGGVLGVALAAWGVRALVSLIGPWLPAVGDVQVDAAVLGFEVDRALFVRMTIPASRYANSTTYLPVAYRMLDEVRRVPGITAAALAKDGPMRAGGEPSSFVIPAQAATASTAAPTANFLGSSDGIIRALGVRLEAGRDLTVQDGDSGALGAVISASLAKAHWPNRSPLGEEIEFQGRRVRIVGVAGDARYTTVQGDPVPMVYVSNRAMTRRIVTIVARTAGDPALALDAARDAIRRVESDQPITEIGTVRDAIGDAVAAPRVLTLLVGLFGLVALLLAAIGVYGVAAYVVGQRTNEIGIRIALGARSADIVRWTLRTGFTPALVGLVGGGVAALMLTRVLSAQLYDVSATDPLVFGAVALVLVVVALFASGIPARRAARVDPAVALRSE